MSRDQSIKQSCLWELVKEFGAVRVPMIQRDYVQGSQSWAHGRRRFLDALKSALTAQNPRPLHLDFIYGIRRSEDDISAFCPLDGQQRLTTLFLLHWYLAAQEDRVADFQNQFHAVAGESRFTYQVRPGCRSLFSALSSHFPVSAEMGAADWRPSAWINETPWFRTAWKRDPSVSSALTMLDAMHECFHDIESGAYERLSEGNRITFQVLDLGSAGLHDDLYLRMNARGRALTPFETFKARFEKFLEKPGYTVCTAAAFSEKIDNVWSNFVWNRYSPKEDFSDDTGSFDSAFINFFRAVALVSLPSRQGKNDDTVARLAFEEPDFDDFVEGAWLSEAFTRHLVHLLDALSGPTGERALAVLGTQWFGGEIAPNLLDLVVRSSGKPDLTDYLQFAACVRFLVRHGADLDETTSRSLLEWMRIVRNLVINTDLEAANFRQALKGLDELIEGRNDALGFLKDSDGKFTGLNRNQTQEERLKASMLLAHSDWRPLITQAEDHAYFRGQIGFLLDFSGTSGSAFSAWTDADHAAAQTQFRIYLARACEMFGPNGLLSKPGFLWERALLAVGDFLLRDGGLRWSFLIKDRSEAASWKRFLRDSHGGRRDHLKTLWDRWETGETLDHIISTVPQTSEAWGIALCAQPAAWAYCGQGFIRYEERPDSPPRICLLKGMSRSGAYTELFTYGLLLAHDLQMMATNPRFSPLIFKTHEERTGSSDIPHLRFHFSFSGATYALHFYCHHRDDPGFSLWIRNQGLPDALQQVLTSAGFILSNDEPAWLVLRQTPGDALAGDTFLAAAAQALRALPAL